ncbi:MAG: nicotinate phosphoribosyltransferase [Elusimicrobia bacterium]|nr:nicotinate phosphoribosyltransferase [Elusimicrobiota bacterium]
MEDWSRSALATDFYELAMAAAYFDHGLHELPAEFELQARTLPASRNYLVAAGLEQALEFLASARFSPADIDFLRTQPPLAKASRGFFSALRAWRFSGDAWAMPEGTPAFAMEPLLRLRAPLLSAQLAETFLLATLGFQTSVASKAARLVAAARGRDVVEFGARRAHGFGAAMFAARAAYLGGCAGTSNTAAGRRFAIPLRGTMAHSFVMAFPDEERAFSAFLEEFPDTATLILDTYDTLAAARLVADRLGPRVPAVRLDSGDLGRLSRRVRSIFDSAGMKRTRIFASNELNERSIAALAEAPIDGFGVGTELSTSADAPALGVVYKLSDLGGTGRLKLSPRKESYPHPKQVWRRWGPDGRCAQDLVARFDEPAPGRAWRPLLEPVMSRGEPAAAAGLSESRARAARELARLPARLLGIEPAAPYPVRRSRVLEEARRRLCEALAGRVEAG